MGGCWRNILELWYRHGDIKGKRFLLSNVFDKETINGLSGLRSSSGCIVYYVSDMERNDSV